MSFFPSNPMCWSSKVSYSNEQACLERSAHTLSNNDSVYQFEVSIWQEDASFTNSKYIIHIPPGEDEYISVNVSLFVIYICTCIPSTPPPQPLFSDQRERFRAPTLSFGNNLIISLTLLSLPEVRLHLVMVSETQTERSCSISVSNNTGVRAGRETPVWQCIVFN